MKILFCSEFYYPYIGGVEIHTQKLAEFFSKKNKVEIATSIIINNSKNRYKNNNTKIKIKRFNIKGNLVKGYSGDISKYTNFLLKNNFDIIFFNAAQQWTFDLSLPILDRIKAKKIFFPCGFSRINNILYKPYYYILQKKINYIDQVICCSKNWKDYLFVKKYYKKKIYILNNGADLNKYKKIKIKKNLGKIFLYVANIKFFKGQDRVINIFKKIKINSTLLLVYSNKGNSTYKNYIFNMIRKFNTDNKHNYKKILFVLNDDRKKIKKYFASSDAFISGSRIEYSPLVLYESLASGIPYFGYDVGICKETICFDYLGKISNKLEILVSSINNYKFDNKNKFNIVNKFKNKFDWGTILNKYKKIILYS